MNTMCWKHCAKSVAIVNISGVQRREKNRHSVTTVNVVAWRCICVGWRLFTSSISKIIDFFFFYFTRKQDFQILKFWKSRKKLFEMKMNWEKPFRQLVYMRVYSIREWLWIWTVHRLIHFAHCFFFAFMPTNGDDVRMAGKSIRIFKPNRN